MATKRPKTPIADPAELMNQQILKARETRRVEKAAAETIDLGLDLKEEAPQNAAELLRDEWDKKTFGDAPKTTTRVIYGPDPLVNACPEFHERLERYGLEGVANAFYELIMQKGALAVPDAIMRRGVENSIKRFGQQKTAKAFFDRVMAIPSRTVEIETDGAALDPLLSNPMREAVARYGQPGKAVKFLSNRCMDVLGKRGYEIVIDEKGDPVKIGTLYMGLIPQDWAERRRQHFADESMRAVAEQELVFADNATKAIRDGGAVGLAPLSRGETVRANPALNDDYSDESRGTGIELGR